MNYQIRLAVMAMLGPLVFTACAATDRPVSAPVGEPVVSVVRTEVPLDPYCGIGSVPDEELPIVVPDNGRITPADRNGFLDETSFPIAESLRAVTQVVVQRAGTCDHSRTLAVAAGAAAITWDGRTDDGDFAPPGVYLVQLADREGNSIALGRVTVGRQDDICALRGADAVKLYETRVAFDRLEFREDLELALPERGHLCLTVEKLSGGLMVPFVGINGVPFVSNQSFTVDTDVLSVSKAVHEDRVKLRLGGAGGSYRLIASLVPDPEVTVPSAAPTNGEIPDSFTCRGRLQSYPHPFGVDRRYWPGLDTARFLEGRRPVARGGVTVKCAVSFRFAGSDDEAVTYAYRRGADGWHQDMPTLYPEMRFGGVAPGSGDAGPTPTALDMGSFIPGYDAIPMSPGFWDEGPGAPRPPPDPRDFIAFSATGVTNDSGAFEIVVDIGDIPANFEIVALTATCQWNGDCKGGYGSLYTSSLVHDGFIDVLDVADVQIGRRVARLITNAGSEPVEKAHFRQPTLTESVMAETAASIESLLASEPQIAGDGIMLPAEMNDLPVVIHEAFDPRDEDSFDYMVWILGGQPMSFRDYQSDDENALLAHGDACRLERANLCYGYEAGPGCKWTPQCDASSSPVTCRQSNVLKALLDAGYDIWLIDHGLNSTATEVARSAPLLYQEILRHPFVDENRPLAVSGLSAGGVAARVALTLWERKDELPQLIAENDLELVRLDQPQLLTESPERVAAYFSFDSPHRGAIVPVAMQVYLNDRNIPSATELALLLKSDEARELTLNYIDPAPDTPCFVYGGRPKDCTLRALTPELIASADELREIDPNAADRLLSQAVSTSLIDASALNKLVYETITVLGGDRGVVPDGLPIGPKSFAIANSWRYGAGPVFSTEEFARIAIEVDGGASSRTFQHQLLDSAQQPRGATNPLFCKAYGIADPPNELLYKTALAACLGDVGGNLNWFVCGTWSVLSHGFGLFSGAGVFREINVTAHLPMRFPTFLPTESAMNVPISSANVGGFADGWEDALWFKPDPANPDRFPVHTDVTEDACKFIRYHLDGTMKGDRDGVPACRADMLASCAGGGMAPGALIDPAGIYREEPGQFCDCDETTLGMFASNACAIRDLPTSINQAIRD